MVLVKNHAVVYLVFSILVVGAFIFGDFLAFVVEGDLPVVDDSVYASFEDSDIVRVVVNKKVDARKGIFRASSVDSVESVLESKSVDAVFVEEKLNMGVVEVSRAELDRLRTDRALSSIRVDGVATTFLDTSTHLIGSSQSNNLVFDNNVTGKGVTVCVIDTGIDYTHSALGGCSVDEFESGSCSKVLGGTNIMYDDTDNPLDDNGHGTHVAGIIGADGSVRGVAPDSRFVAVKALDYDGVGYLSYLSSGIQWCVDNKDLFNISVISISAGGPNTYSDFCDASFPDGATAVANAIAEGMSVVVASGNNGRYYGVNFPACLSGVIPVTSVNGNHSYASTANRGGNFSSLMAAPGVNIYSTVLDNVFGSKSGTSMATPHVSGVIALIHQVYNELNMSFNNSESEDLLLSFGFDLYDLESDKIYPYLQAYDLLLSLDNSKPSLNLFVNQSVFIKNDSIVSVLVNWSTQSNHAFNSSLSVFSPNSSVFFSSDTSFGSEVLSLNDTGKYLLVLDANNTNGFSELNESFFIKEVPVFDFNIINLSNVYGFEGFYNISLNVSSGVYDNISIYLNESLLDKSVAENVSLGSGDNFFRAEHAFTDFFTGRNVSFNFSVLDSSPIIISFNPNITDLVVFENETILFEHVSYNPLGGALNVSWFEKNNVNESFVEVDNYSFSAKGKSNASLTLFVENSFSNVSVSWNVSVLGVPLVEENKSPSIIDVSLEYNDSLSFYFNVSDFFNRSVNYSWFVDDVFVIDGESFLFNASIVESGAYDVLVVANNGLVSLNHSWFVRVMPVPFLIFVNNISDISGEVETNLVVSGSDFFDFYLSGDVPSYSLSNKDIPFASSGEDVIINSDEVLDYFTRVIAVFGDFNVSSNEFRVVISEPITHTSSAGGGGGAPPPSSSFGLDDEVVNDSLDNISDVIEPNVSVTQRISFSSISNISNINKTSSIVVKTVSVNNISDVNVPSFEGVVHSVFSVESFNDSKETIIEFVVDKSWLFENNLSVEDVALFRFVDSWVELNSSVVSEFDDFFVFEALSPGFSYFVVGAREVVPLRDESPVVIELVEEEKNHLFLIIVVIIMISIIISLIKQRFFHNDALVKEKNKDDLETRRRVKRLLKK